MVCWGDVAGVDEAKEELKEVVEFLREQGVRAARRARAARGCCSTARPVPARRCSPRLSPRNRARTSTRRAPPRSSRCSRVSAPPASASCSRRPARTRPSIIFIDELDAVGTQRGGGFTPRARPDAESAPRRARRVRRADEVVIMGASNRLQDLDPALLRPGRFDRQVNVAPPDVHGREAILRVHTRSKPLARGRRPRHARPPHRGADGRRAREHRQRGRDLRRPAQRAAVYMARLRGRHGARAHRSRRSAAS